MGSKNYPICLGIGSVCEKHPDHAWDEQLGSLYGAGMPPKCNGLEEPDISAVIEESELRRRDGLARAVERARDHGEPLVYLALSLVQVDLEPVSDFEKRLGTIVTNLCFKKSIAKSTEVFMAEKDLNALFLDTLKDIYYAEKQIYKSLPKMAKAASSDQLRAAFEKHHDETQVQIERLDQIFELLGKPARGKKCDAIEGILDEGKEIMEEYEGEPALDAGLLAAAQAVEHYEISRYGTLKTWAAKLGMRDAVKLLDQTLAEEKKTDDALTKLADTTVNAEAA